MTNMSYCRFENTARDLNVHDHAFVREAPLEANAFCPLCSEPWDWCACDLPEYHGAWEAQLFTQETDDGRRKAA